MNTAMLERAYQLLGNMQTIGAVAYADEKFVHTCPDIDERIGVELARHLGASLVPLCNKEMGVRVNQMVMDGGPMTCYRADTVIMHRDEYSELVGLVVGLLRSARMDESTRIVQ